jgi:hypothetical protein
LEQTFNVYVILGHHDEIESLVFKVAVGQELWIGARYIKYEAYLLPLAPATFLMILSTSTSFSYYLVASSFFASLYKSLNIVFNGLLRQRMPL